MGIELEQHPVQAEILRRQKELPSDGTRLALAVEGGGMRGVITSGMLAALESYGVTPEVFDLVFASSAGSVASAFYLSGQIRMGTPVYYEDITDEQFISTRRVFFGKPIMNLDFLIKDVIVNRKPLDFARVVSSKKLRVVATDADTATKHVFGPADGKHDIQEYMRASANIPVIGGGPYPIGDRRYLDASLTEAIPWESPVEQGFTHVLVLSSRPLGQARSNNLGSRLLTWVWTRRANELLRNLALRRNETSAARAEHLRELTLNLDPAPPHVYAITPQESDTLPKQLEQSEEALIEACKAGFRAVSRFLLEPEPDEFVTDAYFDRLDRQQ